MKIQLMAVLLVVAASCVQAEIKTVQGDGIDIDKKEWAHLVFFEVWAAYSDNSLQELHANLPEHFRKKVQTIWVQPRFNVTNAQVMEFQSIYPAFNPIVMDENFELMRNFKLWSSPSHVVLNRGEVVFVGDNESFVRFSSEVNLMKVQGD